MVTSQETKQSAKKYSRFSLLFVYKENIFNFISRTKSIEKKMHQTYICINTFLQLLHVIWEKSSHVYFLKKKRITEITYDDFNCLF
jgi:hypothetical protein